MQELKLESGRPESLEGRLDKEIRCYDFLDELGIEYFRCDHRDMNANTMEDCLRIDAVLDAAVCKNLFLCNRQQTQFYLLMMPGDKVFKTKELSNQINSARLSFGTPEYMEKYLDITPGSVSVLGLMNDRENHVKLLVDSDLLGSEYIGAHPCVNTSSLKIRTSDIFGPILQKTGHDMTVVTLKGE